MTRYLESYLHFVHDPKDSRFFTGLSLRQAAWCRDWEAEVGPLEGTVYAAVMKPARMMYEALLKYTAQLSQATYTGLKAAKNQILCTPHRLPTNVYSMISKNVQYSWILRFYNLHHEIPSNSTERSVPTPNTAHNAIFEAYKKANDLVILRTGDGSIEAGPKYGCKCHSWTLLRNTFASHPREKWRWALYQVS